MNRKTIFCVIMIILLLCGTIVWAQSTNGYDKVSWGTSIEETKIFYPNLVEHTRAGWDDPRDIMAVWSDIGIKRYIENNVGNGIKNRRFYFYQEKLFMVKVEYDIQAINPITLKDRLESVYGVFTAFKDEQKQYRDPGGVVVNATLSGLYKNVNNNLKIEIDQINMSFLGQRQSVLWVDYFNPNIWKQVSDTYKKSEEDKKRAETNSVGL